MTTGTLQQLVYLAGERPGRRAVIVGAEHVSFSALATLSHGGARAVAMVTEHPRHQSLAAFRAAAALRFRVPLLANTAVTTIRGLRRVEAVEVTHLVTGEVRELECDLVVFTGDWIPDHELAVIAGAALDPGTRGPAVDAELRTSLPGLFAAGNVLHGAEPADIAALSGRQVAATVLRHLDGQPWPAARVAIKCAPPLHWIAPNAITESSREQPRFRVRAREPLGSADVEVMQGRRMLWRGRAKPLMPGRSARLASGWTRSVDVRGEPIVVRAATHR